MKDKSLTIRLSQAELAIVNQAASSKNISPSTFARSLLITAIKNDLKITPSPEERTSLTPEFDKLDPRVKFALLKPIEMIVHCLRAENANESEIEDALVFAVASNESEIKNRLLSLKS